jgi:crossover junction endodeoxyribonuclease RuvC
MGISLQQFEQMTARMKKPRRSVAPKADPVSGGPNSINGVILGIDPSLRGTGFGVIRAGKLPPQLVTCGTITCPAEWEKTRCLARIGSVFRDVLKMYKPDICVVEGLFYAQNFRTAIIMGEARGAALAPVAEAGVDIFEIAPRKVKQAIVGYGAARKLAVAKMVQRMLNLAELPGSDEADALALALTHVQTQGRFGLGTAKRI